MIRDLSSIRNQYASTQLSADTVVLKEQLSTTSPINVITSRIPEGFRAVSIPVDAESGVEGWARPGARVDVVWSTEHRGRKLVTTIVENAEVLSAERSTETDTATQMGQPLPSHITLLVSLKDAQRIHLAKASGALSLNLRGDTDNQSGTVETISMEKLLKPIVSKDIGEIQGKVTLNGEEFVFAEGKLIPVKDLKIEDEEKQEEPASEEKASWQPEVRARMKLEDEKK
ncbi:MAG: Flp pilus assembly protein CpaB [SAR324 cluster bacterium]|uniref:Flp pilus assembly protein CpaB n=1 Tax=SAR324 cluster bacterium TaxID=2024889 RepID=A0A7X9IJC2_9DELT|nr:Flp pilus assembly protein CpaB [SAR324 cluster bacterium]